MTNPGFFKFATQIKVPRWLTDEEAWKGLSGREKTLFFVLVIEYYKTCDSWVKIHIIESALHSSGLRKSLHNHLDRFTACGLLTYHTEGEDTYYRIEHFEDYEPVVKFESYMLT